MNANARSRRISSVPSGSPVRVRVIVCVLAAALYVASIGGLLTSAESATPATTAGACSAGTPTSGPCVEIGEYDIAFTPNLITIPADTPVRVMVVNHGVTAHNFSVTDHRNSGVRNLNVSIDTDPGKTAETTITAPEGAYYFYCNVPGHEQAGMFGYLKVTKGATVSTQEATVTPPAG